MEDKVASTLSSSGPMYAGEAPASSSSSLLPSLHTTLEYHARRCPS